MQQLEQQAARKELLELMIMLKITGLQKRKMLLKPSMQAAGHYKLTVKKLV